MGDAGRDRDKEGSGLTKVAGHHWGQLLARFAPFAEGPTAPAWHRASRNLNRHCSQSRFITWNIPLYHAIWWNLTPPSRHHVPFFFGTNHRSRLWYEKFGQRWYSGQNSESPPPLPSARGSWSDLDLSWFMTSLYRCFFPQKCLFYVFFGHLGCQILVFQTFVAARFV